MKVVWVSFKKLYFYPLFICATLALGIQVGVNLWRSEDVISTSNIILVIAVLVGLIGSIVVRRNEKGNQE